MCASLLLWSIIVYAVALADNDMRIDLKTRTKWANLAKTTLSVFEGQLDEVLEIDWKPIMDKVNHVSQGEVNEYYGPVVLASGGRRFRR